MTYYRTVLKQKGELVYDVPATHEFDVGKYREETMAFPPGVTIKDFQSDISQGYPNPKPGGQPARFPTIIQIVPVTREMSHRTTTSPVITPSANGGTTRETRRSMRRNRRRPS